MHTAATRPVCMPPLPIVARLMRHYIVEPGIAATPGGHLLVPVAAAAGADDEKASDPIDQRGGGGGG